jgi:hypothetical protein
MAKVFNYPEYRGAGYPDHLKEIIMKSDLPDFSNYTSNRVFEGVKVLKGKEAEEAKARMKRAFDRLKNNTGK